MSTISIVTTTVESTTVTFLCKYPLEKIEGVFKAIYAKKNFILFFSVFLQYKEGIDILFLSLSVSSKKNNREIKGERQLAMLYKE